MTKTLLVHFDGKVLVPEEPVDLPVGQTMQVTIPEPSPNSGRPVSEVLAEWIKNQPPVDRGDLPTDGAAQYKHYLYGHPKKP